MSDNHSPQNNTTNESSETNFRRNGNMTEAPSSFQNYGAPPPYEIVDRVPSAADVADGSRGPPYPTTVPKGFPQPPVFNIPQTIVQQPSTAGASEQGFTVQTFPNCPPGLEYLQMVDQLLVHQQIELLEVLTGFETKNRYHVRNTLGQDVFYAVEDSDCCTRNCCGPIRPFDMKIFDNFKTEVIHLYRPLACDSCCFPCCLQSMEVTAPPGIPIGTVQQEWSIFYPTFAVKDSNGDTILRIEGPFWTCSCCCNDVKFKITSADGMTELGKITKQWSGFVREAFTDADNFGITFPMDLDVKLKAVLLGGLFLIDMMFFEKSGNNN